MSELNDICPSIAHAHNKVWEDAIVHVMKHLYGEALYDPAGPFGYAAWVLEDMKQHGIMNYHRDGRQEFAWMGMVVLRGSEQMVGNALVYRVEVVKEEVKP